MFPSAGFAGGLDGLVPATHSHPEGKVRPSLAQGLSMLLA
jgi:hypothetical protein